MSNPVQINNNESDTIEMPLSEYEAIVGFSTKIAEQNALVLDSIKAVNESLVKQAENLTATFASLVDAIKAIKIDVNVPDQPAPIVNLPAPVVEVKSAPIKMTLPRIKQTKETIKRHKDSGLAETSVTIYEYNE